MWIRLLDLSKSNLFTQVTPNFGTYLITAGKGNVQLSVTKRMHVYMETTAITLDPFMPTKFEVGTERPSTICVYNIIE